MWVILVLVIIMIILVSCANTEHYRNVLSPKLGHTKLITPNQHCKINCARCPRDYKCKRLNITEEDKNPENMTDSCYCVRHTSY